MRTTKFDILFSGIMLVSTPCYSSWTKQTVDSSNSQLGWDASIGVDSNNIPHIAYGDTANGLQKYAKWTGTAWSVETVDSASLAGSHTSIRVTSSGYPYFSYYNGSLRFAKKIGSTWTRETVTTGYNYHTSIALDSNSWPAITYYDGSTKYLKYVKRGSSAWGAPETVDTGDSGYYSSLEFDSSNYPAIAYYDSINYDLKYAKWNGSSWVKQTVDSTGDVGEYVSLALDSSNNPHISYLDRTNYNLKYAKWNGSSWVKQTVDPAGDVGGNTSIALDAAGNPHITYYDFTNIAVKYAKWNGSSWQIETVDSPGGSFASIAIDNNGNPHIAYASSGVQKYATITAGDSWDPIDDTAINGTPITPTTASQSHGPHIISGSDLADWFRIYMSAGNSYHFDTIGGSGDDYGELYSNSAGTTLVASNDDGGGNGQFTFDYVAPNTQNYYLKVRAYTAGDIWSGSLNYYYTAGGGGYMLATAVSPSGSGTVSKSPSQATYTSGASVLLTANPASGYLFSNWSVDASGTANPTTIVMNSNKSVTANFTAASSPVLHTDKTYLNFGEVTKGTQSGTQQFQITNSGSGTLSGNIYTYASWISVSPDTFNGTTTVSVRVSPPADGQYLDRVIINSTGGTAQIDVSVLATCVITKPNPYSLSSGGMLKFFGSGVVPYNTKINIYTLAGDLVRTLEEHGGQLEMSWDGRNSNGNKVVPGIYLYTSSSPKEKTHGQFTIVK